MITPTRRLFMAMLGGAGLSALVAGCANSIRAPGFLRASMNRLSNVLYVQTNNRAAGQNAVLAYVRGSDGSLTPLNGSPFMTGGKGHNNPTAAKLGPNDLDFALLASPDRSRLFAVNAGSNTIAVFDIGPDGALTPVAGSPFPSGGRNPVGLTMAGNRLYVVNKNQDADQPANGDLPNYTGFDVAEDGRLTPIPGSTMTRVAEASPSQILASRDGRLLFGCDFLAPVAQPGIGSLPVFRVARDGALTPAQGSPFSLPPGPVPPPPLPLGLWLHPSRNILYVGFVTRAQVGVYTYDQGGTLSFVHASANTGKEICWIRTTADGRRLYTVNNIDNSVSFYDNTDPLRPVERQKLVMKEPGPMFLNDRGPDSFMQVTSTPFETQLSPDERFLYVINQRVNARDTTGEGNKMHILSIASDGTLSEPSATLRLPVPSGSRPHGLVVF